MNRAEAIAAVGAVRQLLVAALLTAFAAAAHANALDTFGVGARGEAMAGAQTADASGWAAAMENPAGVARTASVEAAVGYGYGVTRLSISTGGNGGGSGGDSGVTTPRGTTIGLAVPIPLGALQAAFAVALYLPDQFIARVQLVPVAEPHFILLDNNLQHIVVTPALALRPWRWLSFGLGATLLADAAGNGITFDVGASGGEKVGRAALDVSLPIRAAPVAGVLVEPIPGLRFGATYRGEIDLKLKLDILANVDVAGAVKGDVLISLRAINFYTPARFTLGAAWDVLPSLTLAADLAFVRWSGFAGGTPDLAVLIHLGITPSLAQAFFSPDRFHDTLAPRIGGEYRRAVGGHVTLAARAGYAFERSPVPDQTGLTSFADNDRHIIAVGGGVALDHVTSLLAKPLKLDLALQWQELQPRTTLKDPRYFPGAGLASSGRIIHLAATMEARF